MIFASTLSSENYDGMYRSRKMEQTWRGVPSLGSLPPVKDKRGIERCGRDSVDVFLPGRHVLTSRTMGTSLLRRLWTSLLNGRRKTSLRKYIGVYVL